MAREYFYSDSDASYSGYREKTLPGTTSVRNVAPLHGDQIWNGSAWADKAGRIDKMRESKLVQADSEADKRIESEATQNAQIHLLAGAVQTLYNIIVSNGLVRTREQQTDADIAIAVWDKMQSVRDKGEQIKSDISALADNAVENYKVSDDGHWK